VNIVQYMTAKWIYGHYYPLKVLEKIGIKENEHLIIIGCGFGDTVMLAHRNFGCKLTAADIYHEAVEKTRLELSSKKAVKIDTFYINEWQPHFVEHADHALIEGVLSFCREPIKLMEQLKNYVERYIAVIDIVKATEKKEKKLLEIFGPNFIPRTEKEIEKILHLTGLQVLHRGETKPDLLKKFIDDMKAAPFKTILGLLKTLSITAVRKEYRKHMARFLSLYKPPHSIKISYFIARKRAPTP